MKPNTQLNLTYVCIVLFFICGFTYTMNRDYAEYGLINRLDLVCMVCCMLTIVYLIWDTIHEA